MHVPDPLQAAINWLSMLVLPILLLIFNAAASTLAGVAVRAAAVRAVLGALCGWVQIYSRLLDECEREIRRADFRRDLLWGRYRRLRRRGYAGADLAIQRFSCSGMGPRSLTTGGPVDGVPSLQVRDDDQGWDHPVGRSAVPL